MCGAELTSLPDTVQQVAGFLSSRGHPQQPVMLGDAARTAQQAADALGVELGQIAKSIVFRRKADNAAVLVVISGDCRVDEKKVEALVCHDGKRLARADAAFVKTYTGYSIGGVAPLAHATEVLVLLDRSLLRFEQVWAAAGHPNAVFSSMPQELELLTGAPLVDVAVDRNAELSDLHYAINLITARAGTVPTCGDIVPSPCISVCRNNADSGLCEGCFRTLGEISAWGRSGNDSKRRLWSVIEERVAAAQVCS